MIFEEVWAEQSVKHFLQESIAKNRVSHAQLFVGKPGWGTLDMALAYAQALICNEKLSCQNKIQNLSHPDLHFSIPTFNMDKRKAITKNYFPEFKELIHPNHFATLNDWYEKLDAGNKQGFLSKDEIMEVMNTLSLKSYEGGYKVLIIWNADRMRVDYANKFLKLLEEPPEKTLFLLLTESTEHMLDTITSRCLTVNFKPLSKEQLSKYAEEHYALSAEERTKLVKRSEGDIHRLQQLISENENKQIFENEFVEWTRNAFMVRKNVSLLEKIINQGETIASWNTEKQKQYVQYCMNNFRAALMRNYQVHDLGFADIENENFNFDKFSQFVSGANIEAIIEELNQTYFYIERNANKKLAFVNLGIKLTRLIHKKY